MIVRAALASLLAFTLACGGDDSHEGAAAEAPSPAEAPAPATRPEGTELELRFEGGEAALRAIRDEMRAPALRALFPETIGDVIEQLAPVPERLRAAIAPDARVVGLRVGEASVVAVGVRGGREPFGPNVQLLAGAPVARVGSWPDRRRGGPRSRSRMTS